MKRVLVLAALIGAALVWPAAAWAAPFVNADCVACHATGSSMVVHTVDFSVPAVDKTRCSVCHGLGAHPPHGFGADCASCHSSWPTTGISLPIQSTYDAGPFGYFNGPSSLAADGPTLHGIHSRRQWPADLTSRGLKCGKCHGAVACDACHGAVAHDAHPTQNGNPAPAAPVANVSPVPTGTFAPDYFQTVSCAAAECHAGIGGERVVEDTDASVSVDANWTRYTFADSGIDFLAGTAYGTFTTGAVLTVPFTGNQVSIWGFTGSTGGALDVYIDDVFVGRKDMWEAGFHPMNGVFVSDDIGSGSHTLRIVSAASSHGGTEVYFDRIVARDFVASAESTPACSNCHPDRVDPHGYDTAQHTTAWGIAGCVRAGCHGSSDLLTEHASWISGFACADCHAGDARADVRQAIADGRTSCDACHAGFPAHADAHVVDDSAECAACHAEMDPIPIHAGSPLGGCPVCHSNPSGGDLTAGKTTADCAQCHDLSPVDPKHYDAAKHTAVSSATCGSCHGRELAGEHTGPGFEPGTRCLTCHTGDKFAALTRPWIGTCDACHAGMHGGMKSSHTPPSGLACVVCHNAGDVSIMHRRAKTTVDGLSVSGCRVCHVDASRQPGSADCTICHPAALANMAHWVPGVLRGQVIDARTGQPVLGAVVEIDRSITVKTGSRGAFLVRDFSLGPHTVRVSRRGYATTTSTVTMRGGQMVVAVQLRLTPLR